MNLFFLKISHFISYVSILLIKTLLHFKKVKINKGTCLIVRLDSIGDYILQRNLFKFLKENERFHNYSFSLCGNIVWKDMAEYFDRDIFSEFIWVDRKKYNLQLMYKYKLLKKIYRAGYEIVIEPTYSREILFGDSIVRLSNAEKRIGFTGGEDGSPKWKRKLVSDSYYTELIESKKENMFEFYRNKEFIEKVLNTKLRISRTSLDALSINYKLPTDNNYIVVSPGAQFNNRIWNPENFIAVINSILGSYDLDIVITGSQSETHIADRITKNIRDKRLLNLAGKTNLVELVKIISRADLLITNESMGVHLAAALNVPFVCISTGQHFGRFNPYPEEIFENGYYIYPDEIKKRMTEYDKLAEEFRYEAVLDINSIKPEPVLSSIKEVITKTHGKK